MNLTLETLAWALMGAGLVLLLAALLFFRHPTWIRDWLKGSLGLGLIALALLVLALGWNLRSWEAVAADDPIETVSVSRVGEQQWQITLESGNAGPLSHQIMGELLEIDGRILALEAPLEWLGVPLLFQRNDPAGRYLDRGDAALDPGNGQSRPGVGIDPWQWSRWVPIPGLRAERAVPVYLPLGDEAVFDIHLRGHQLEAAPRNEVAEELLEDW